MNPVRIILDKIYPFIEPVIIKQNSVTVSPADLFFAQTKDGVFCRPDMIVRYLFIENYFGKNSCGKKLYTKMQTARINETDEPVKRFNALIDSYEKNGYNPDSYIMVKQNLSIRNDSHRGALALYYNTPLTCFVEKDNSFVRYELSWFRENGFEDDEIRLITDKTDELYRYCNAPLNIFLFDSAAKCADSIAEALGCFGTVKEIFRYRFQKNQLKSIGKAFALQNGNRKNLLSMCCCYSNISVIKLVLNQPEIKYTHSNKQVFFKQYDEIKKLLHSTFGKEFSSLAVIPHNFDDNSFFDEISDLLNSHSNPKNII